MGYSLVTNDTGSKLRVTCKDNTSGAVINLSGATVVCRWRKSDGTVVTKTMTVTDAAGGIAEYQFLAGEIIYPTMLIEVEITDSGGKILTSLDPMTLYVRSQIG